MSWNTFISLSVAKESLIGHNIFVSLLLTFRPWYSSFPVLLSFIVADEKFEGNSVLLCYLLSHTAFRIISLHCTFDILITLYHRTFLLCSCLSRYLYASCVWNDTIFSKFGKFCAVISLNTLSIQLELYLCSFYTINSQVWTLECVQDFLEIYLMLLNFFLICVCLYYYL